MDERMKKWGGKMDDMNNRRMEEQARRAAWTQQHQFGNKADTEQFEEWEKKHFDNLKRNRGAHYNNSFAGKADQLPPEQRRVVMRQLKWAFALIMAWFLYELGVNAVKKF